MSSVRNQQRSALVIDPDRARSGTLSDLLRTAGITGVRTERDIENAWRSVLAFNPPLLFVAARVSPMDGFEFTKTFRRSEDVRNNDATIILLFNNAELTDVQNALNAGADAALSFPVSQMRFNTLLSALNQHKRPFVRSVNYVGPCRRRGMVGSASGRRLSDLGGAEALAVAVEALEQVFEGARRYSVLPESLSDGAADALAGYFHAVGAGKGGASETLRQHCRTIVAQFIEDAPKYENFDRAFLPLRRKFITALAARKQDAKTPV